jgi:aspartate-semialdehyde dehydrogenase
MTETNQRELTVAVAGATGAVGREMLEILDERDFPVGSLRAMASARSAGKMLPFGDGEVEVEELAEADFDGVDIALFSAGSSVSLEHAPRAAEAGAVVIDNTSAFRMDPEHPLVVPEVNAHVLEAIDGPEIIANPNCSTIQMVVALAPLAEAVGLERVVVSTYQSASGAGQGGVTELIEELKNWADAEDGEEWEAAQEVFAHPLAFEALPHIGSFDESGFTTEELKMVNETRKIMEQPDLSVASHCVRVPAIRAHSESLTVDLAGDLTADEARRLWEVAPGVKVYDEPAADKYPLARMAAETDATWLGRIRGDVDRSDTLHFWCVSDNLRKGAALNSIQIAERLIALGNI